MSNVIDLEEFRRKIENPPIVPPEAPMTLEVFYWRAMHHVAQHRSATAINLNTPECAAWEAYFLNRGFQPYFMRALRAGQLAAATLPAQWPEWFDPDYQAAG